MVLGPGEGLHAFQMLGTGAIDVLAHRHRTDEGHRAHRRVHQQRIDLLAAAMQHLQYAGRCAGLEEQFSQTIGRHRVLFRGFENEGIAAGDGQRKHPQRNHRREVERGDADAHAQWLDPTGGVDLAGDVFHRLAHHQAGDIGGVFGHFDAAPDVALGIGEGLAGFRRENLRQLVVVFLEQVLVAQHQAGALRYRHLAPGEEGFLRTGHCGLDFLGSGFGGEGDHFLGGRVGDFDQLTSLAGLPLAVDQLR